MAPEKVTKEEKVHKKSNFKNQQKSTSTYQGKNNPNDIVGLQKLAGNRAVQRFVVQKMNSDSGELDNETIGRINHERAQGHTLDSSVQTRMSQASGMDFSHVDVHTSPEADSLNRQLNAKAFTTGKDIFFREGEYQPHSSAGQNLITHELTHVVQQSSGQVPTGDTMRVNPPDDVYEKQADAVSQMMTSPNNSPGIQRQEMEEEEEVQTMRLQKQEMPEEEEEVQTMRVQKQEVPEEEELA